MDILNIITYHGVLTDLICILSTPLTFPIKSDEAEASTRQEGKSDAFKLVPLTVSFHHGQYPQHRDVCIKHTLSITGD